MTEPSITPGAVPAPYAAPTERVQTWLDGSTLHIRFNNPVRHNALSVDMWEAVPPLLALVPDAGAYTPIRHRAADFGLDCVPGGEIASDNSAAIWDVIRDRLARLGPPHTSDWAVISGLQDL